MASTVKVRNISGHDLNVPTPAGGFVTVAAGHQAEFEAEHARGLLEQDAVWERVKDAPKDKDN